MARRLQKLARLEDVQLRASSPRDHAALSASAGTGKTHVLTARVLRLLLAGVEPSTILCLTFTKAGAAEMAQRIHERLAYWVRLKDSDLGAELAALGEDPGPPMRDRAHTLFARVLESTGAGLRIQTIHAFAQGLLAAFPAEAELTPGFRPLDEREERQLARATLADLLVRSEGAGDRRLVRDLQALSLRLGEGGAETFLAACARAPEAMAALGPREGVEARLRHLFGLPLGDVEEAVASACADEMSEVAGLRRLGEANRAWGTKSGIERADLCEQWLAADPAGRASLLQGLHAIWAKADGEPRSFGKGQAPQDPDYAALAEAAFECCARLLRMRTLAGLVAVQAAGLRAGQAFAQAYAEAKRAAGAVDFDDLIRWAEGLLLTPGMGEWVRFKLDQRTDHILVDEAQDTNARQWNIVRAIALEYFAGEGARGRHRTVFTVGDYKQAIFGFQGTDPASFDVARAWFARQAQGTERAFLDLSVDRSFRSSPPILEAVDRVLGNLGHEALGLPRRPNPHRSNEPGRAGSVVLWPPWSDETDGDEEAGEEGWVSDALRRYASRLAKQVKAWLDSPFELGCRGRPLRPEDILILVRRRGELASLLVARLHAEGVPVAGVDRLLLSAPLAVQDLLAAARFAVQPLDDLNLASLLVSPLFGWTQDELHAVAAGRAGALWPRLRGHDSVPAETLAGLHDILAMADYATPHFFFETILSGKLDGRRRLLGRLGREAADPIAELVSAAIDHESSGAASLQGFLDWFARGEVEVVRDPSGPLDSVRVMTVHGAKGLQSPVVLLADACADPDRLGPNARLAALPLGEGEGAAEAPVFRPRRDELAEPLASRIAAQDRLDREEHWRLLYVALTRAEERLYVGGALGARDRGVAPEASWHRALENALVGLGRDWGEAPGWGREMRFGDLETLGKSPPETPEVTAVLPDWARRPAPEEERPPRPLSATAPAEDETPWPPPGPDRREAARRGRLLHQLFERLPAVAPERREELAAAWLERSAGVADPALRQALVADARRIVEDPRFADLFGPEALAEAPIAAVLDDGAVVAGTVDRLLVGDERVRVADFKTGREAPASAADAPPAHLRQMAVYRAALRTIFPGRAVEAALLYTAGPVLLELPDTLLNAHLPSGG